MAVVSGPKITGLRDLALSIDMGNVKSYPGSGTTINNQISPTNNELSNKASLYETYDLETADYVVPNPSIPALPTYTSNSASSTATFNGIANYLSFTTPSLSTTISVEIWARLGAGYSNNMMIGFDTYNIFCLNGGLGFTTSNNDLYGISSATVTSLGLVNNWKHYVFEMRTDVSYTNNKIYVNTVAQTLSQQTGTESTANRKLNNYGAIAGWTNTPGYEMPMSFGLMRIYNRALTQTEITDNYNLFRGRYL